MFWQKLHLIVNKILWLDKQLHTITPMNQIQNKKNEREKRTTENHEKEQKKEKRMKMIINNKQNFTRHHDDSSITIAIYVCVWLHIFVYMMCGVMYVFQLPFKYVWVRCLSAAYHISSKKNKNKITQFIFSVFSPRLWFLFNVVCYCIVYAKC